MPTPDETEEIRRLQQAQLNAPQSLRQQLEEAHGQVWDREQLEAEFKVIGFLAPIVVVRRRADDRKGSLYFQHEPRFYFKWNPHEEK
jgi:hypothetical protein